MCAFGISNGSIVIGIGISIGIGIGIGISSIGISSICIGSISICICIGSIGIAIGISINIGIGISVGISISMDSFYCLRLTGTDRQADGWAGKPMYRDAAPPKSNIYWFYMSKFGDFWCFSFPYLFWLYRALVWVSLE